MSSREVNPQNRQGVIDFQGELGKFLAPIVKKAKRTHNAKSIELRNDYCMFMNKNENNELTEIELCGQSGSKKIEVSFYPSKPKQKEKFEECIRKFEQGKVTFDPRIFNFEGTQVSKIMVFDMQIGGYIAVNASFEMNDDGKIYRAIFDPEFKNQEFYQSDDSKLGKYFPIGAKIIQQIKARRAEQNLSRRM